MRKWCPGQWSERRGRRVQHGRCGRASIGKPKPKLLCPSRNRPKHTREGMTRLARSPPYTSLPVTLRPANSTITFGGRPRPDKKNSRDTCFSIMLSWCLTIARMGLFIGPRWRRPRIKHSHGKIVSLVNPQRRPYAASGRRHSQKPGSRAIASTEPAPELARHDGTQ
jgi:hypothetical protein